MRIFIGTCFVNVNAKKLIAFLADESHDMNFIHIREGLNEPIFECTRCIQIGIGTMSITKDKPLPETNGRGICYVRFIGLVVGW